MVLRSIIRNFLKLESSSGILLLFAGILALIFSNSNFEDFSVVHITEKERYQKMVQKTK